MVLLYGNGSVIQLCSSLVKLLWQFRIHYNSICIWGSVLLFLLKNVTSCIAHVDCLDPFAILPKLRLLIHKHKKSSPFINLFFSFVQQCFVVSAFKSFTTLVKFIPKYFIILDAVTYETVFLVFFLIVLCWHMETQLIVEYWSYTLKLCWIHYQFIIILNKSRNSTPLEEQKQK